MSREFKSEQHPTNRGLSMDAKVFLGAVIGGFILMSLLKWGGVPQLVVTVAIAGLVVAYSVAVVRMSRLHLRLDQAGDNAYYLGLVFTLFSMGWALWEVGRRIGAPGDGNFSVAEAVIGDFGLALGTTLAGIICRIVLHQMRVDPADVESESRMQLAQAANRMVVQLNDLGAQFGEFVTKLQHKQQDYANEMADVHKAMREEFSSRMEKAVEESANAMERVTSQVGVSITAFADAADVSTHALTMAAERLGAVEPPPARLNQRFDTMADKVGVITNALSETSERLILTVQAMRQASEVIGPAVDAVGRLGQSVATRLEEQQESFTNTLTRVDVTVAQLNGTVSLWQENVAKLEQDSGKSAEAVLAAEASAVEVLDRLTNVVRKVEESMSNEKVLINDE